jgi:hypothetical protein
MSQTKSYPLRFNKNQLELLLMLVVNGWGDGQFGKSRMSKPEMISVTNIIKKIRTAKIKLENLP